LRMPSWKGVMVGSRVLLSHCGGLGCTQLCLSASLIARVALC
jgi:hypothetical protein